MEYKPSKPLKIFANCVAAFIPDRKMRGRVRRAIKYNRFAEMRALKRVKQHWRDNGDNLTPARYDEYDLIFGIGTTCHIASILDFHNLRRFSTPFDGTGGTEPDGWGQKPNVWRNCRFNEKIDALCNEFRDYFNPSDLQIIGAPSCPLPHLYVINMRTNIRFLHFADSNISMELQMPDLQRRMSRRAQNLISAINKSNKILICWSHRTGAQRVMLDATVSDADIKNAVKKLHNKWPDKTFDLVFFEHDGNLDAYQVNKICVCDGAYRIQSNHFCNEPSYYYTLNRHHDISERIRINNSCGFTLAIEEALGNIHLSGRLSDMKFYD